MWGRGQREASGNGVVGATPGRQDAHVQQAPMPAVREEDQKNILAAFEKWDLKRNGYISESELKHVLNALGIDATQVHAMFCDVDKNRDGKIDYQEFVRWLYGSAPVQVRQTALASTFQLKVTDIFLQLEDDPSFEGWFSDANSIRPFVRWRDLFTERVVCDSPEGVGLKSRIPLSGRPALLFDILEDGSQAVAVEVCLHRTMRSDKVLGSGKLSLSTVAAEIAQGKGKADRIVVEVFDERVERSPSPTNKAGAAPAVNGVPGSPANNGAVPATTGNEAAAPGSAAAPLGGTVPAKAAEPAGAAAPAGTAAPAVGATAGAGVGTSPTGTAAAASAPPKPKGPRKVRVLVGRVFLGLAESPVGCKTWAKRKVDCWTCRGMPPLCSLSDVSTVFESLVVKPEQNLEFSLMQAAEALALARVDGYSTWDPEDARAALEDLAKWLGNMEELARRSDEVYRRTAARLSKIGDRVASVVLTASLDKNANHQLMRHALKFATNIDPCLPELAQVESKFKMILKFPDRMKLSDLLMASEQDMVRMEPASLGLELTFDGESLPRVEESKRYGIRDETAQRVLAMLGGREKIKTSKGSNYERIAMDRLSHKDFKLSPQLSALLAKARVFPGEQPAAKRSIQAVIASRTRDWEALLGRFDVVGLPCRAEYDVGFNKLPKDQMPSGFFGQDPRETIGGKGWFWVLHAAAINIGENKQADDFREYSKPMAPGQRGRRGGGRCLDEDRYVSDMATLWKRSLEAAAQLGVEDMIAFPFGMGAFHRNLHQLDNRYTDPALMRRLKFLVAQGLFTAAADICTKTTPPMRLHVCLVDGGLEARMNHNVFVESAAEKVKELPALGKLLKFHRNCDALELAHRLASSPSPPAQAGEEVRKVGLLNGANNKLLGNHWFSNGARNAIDENLHRRSGSMCAGSLLVNMSTAPQRRNYQELVMNVEMLGGKSIELLPYPEPAKGVDPISRILERVECVGYSVLGTQMAKGHRISKVAPEPDGDTAFVDPAGLPYIQSSPGGAGGASGQIYKFLGISHHPSFPDDVRMAITEPLQAKFHAYGDKLVIHVVGPNFQGRMSCTYDDALDELSQAYASALAEFAACPARRLRMLPISSSIFAGKFQKDMPDLTAQALTMGFEMLGKGQQERVLSAESLDMCIFSEAELDDFEEAFTRA